MCASQLDGEAGARGSREGSSRSASVPCNDTGASETEAARLGGGGTMALAGDSSLLHSGAAVVGRYSGPLAPLRSRGAENICQVFGCRHDLLTNVQLLVTDPNDSVKVSLKKTSDRVRVSQRRIYFSLIIGVSFKCTCSRVCFK
uniref:Uncharacterized protein n=1 Tax=Trichogramma kaykai TaxID=54128 RepID=A0ABD2VVE3_9HYME